MPHEAAAYLPAAAGIKTPGQTQERVLDEVQDSREEYAQGVRSTIGQYSYLTAGTAAPITPDLASFTPESAPSNPAGTPISIVVNGSGFLAGSKVNWNGSDLTPTAWTATTLTVTAPASTTVQGVPVYVDNTGLKSNAKNFKWTAAAQEEPVKAKAKSKK